MSYLPFLENAWLLCEEGRIRDFGNMDTCPIEKFEEISAEGRMVLPAFCDSHTHLVFAASRHEEFVNKIKGLSYEEIASRGGGILNSARKIADTTEDSLYDMAMQRIEECIRYGTGAIEIKSGYGLSSSSEIKMLRVIKRLKKNAPIPIIATFLGAHTYPMDYRNNHRDYIKIIVEEMLPQIATEGLAEYADAFCEKGFFSPSECDQIFEAATQLGLGIKLHANQMSRSGGVQTGVKWKARSVDHLEYMGEEEYNSLAKSDTIATLLPGAAFYLRSKQAPAREMLARQIIIALATDYNPGSSPSGNMQLAIAIACIQMKITPQEAINAATVNGAAAMGLETKCGSITRGLLANLIITHPLEDIAQMPYYFGKNHVWKMILAGKDYHLNNNNE